MAHVTKSRHYPVDREEAFAYLTKPSTWPDYYSGILEIDDPEGASFHQAGDTVSFTYSLLGRRLDGRATLEEIREGELVRHTAAVPGLPDVHQTWEYRDDDGGFAVEVTLTTEESTSFLGRTIDRVVIPRALQKDLDRTLDRLEEIFALGIPEA